MFAKGTRGDVAPVVAIGAALRRRDHDVTLVSNCHHHELAADAGIADVAIDDSTSFAAALRDQPLLNDLRTVRSYYARHVVPYWRREYRIMESLSTKPNSAVVTIALANVAAFSIAEALDRPLIRVFISPPQAQGLPFLGDFYRTILAQDINAFRQDVGLPAVGDWQAWLSSPSVDVGNWPSWFAGPSRPGCRSVGFLMCDGGARSALPERLETVLGSGPILITGGSGNFMGARFYQLAIAAAQLLDKPAVVVTRYRHLLPPTMPPDVQWYASLPLSQVMPRVAAVVHHGGINTIAGAIAAGVGQVVLPESHDRVGNARNVARIGVGSYVPTAMWTAEAIAEALVRLGRADAVIRINRYRRLLVDEARVGPDRCADLIESVLNGTPAPHFTA